MPRPESHIRPDDIYKITRQRLPGSGAPYYSVVCRLFDDDGKEHLHTGVVKNPGQWARWMRARIDNPPAPPEDMDNG